jgi:hypothetical protein
MDGLKELLPTAGPNDGSYALSNVQVNGLVRVVREGGGGFDTRVRVRCLGGHTS